MIIQNIIPEQYKEYVNKLQSNRLITTMNSNEHLIKRNSNNKDLYIINNNLSNNL